MHKDVVVDAAIAAVDRKLPAGLRAPLVVRAEPRRLIEKHTGLLEDQIVNLLERTDSVDSRRESVLRLDRREPMRLGQPLEVLLCHVDPIVDRAAIAYAVSTVVHGESSA